MEGRGLHGGRPCSVTVAPADSGGLRFLHVASGTVIPATAEHAECGAARATALSRGGARIGTVEHLLSALSGLGVDHAAAAVDGDELPILDGSCGGWARAIAKAGLRDLPSPRACIRVLKAVCVASGGRRISVGPAGGLVISCTIDFPCPSIGRQSLELPITPDRYRRELADARTFCMERDIAAMRARGLALGGSLDNAVVFDDDRCLNGPLRFHDEAVRHKMLDIVGDMALLGAPLLGRVEAFAAGHAMHVELARRLLAEPGAWAVEAGPGPRQRPAKLEFARGLAAV